MEKQTLTELENRCIQDQPPECEAACPLHLDARSFIHAVGKNDWRTAWNILRKTLPLPGILGRICDAPCRRRCKRREAGDPIEIGALERLCVSMPAPPYRIPKLPQKRKRAAMAGSGISGLTAAWDLAKKGYEIHIFDPGSEPGGPLLAIEPERLPPEALAAEIKTLCSLNVTIHPNSPVDSVDFFENCAQDYDAVYLALDAVSGSAWPLERDSDRNIMVSPKIRATSREGVYAGGRPQKSSGKETVSVVGQAAEGRWAATSIDRYLQKVSLTAGREKEGPHPTRLYTNIDGVETAPAVVMADPSKGYTPEEAAAEAARCTQCQCLECVSVCHYLEHFKGYPKKYAREIYNNESIVMGARQSNKLINSCSLCGLCETVCPEDFSMAKLCLTTRQSMVERDKMPPSAHEFALMDMAFSQSEQFAVFRHEPGRTESAYLFFPGCQLCASDPEHVVRVYQYLRHHLSDKSEAGSDKAKSGVGLMLDCCAAPALWAGRETDFKAALTRFEEKWREMGGPRIITACATCYLTFRDHLPDLPVTSLWQVMAEQGLPEGIASQWKSTNAPVAVLDPCTTRHEADVRSAVRQILDRLNVEVEELILSGETTECCGFGGLMQNANPDVARETVRRRAKQSQRDYVAYCAMCRDNLATAEKRTLHLLDLIFPNAVADDGESDPADRPRPGWSERRDNRARLKTRLLKEIWEETSEETSPCSHIQLTISPEVAALLDQRRILEEDLRQVIDHAETGGQKFRHPATGHFKAALKIYNTTFWADYSPAPEGYEIHNAYAHRMVVKSA